MNFIFFTMIENPINSKIICIRIQTFAQIINDHHLMFVTKLSHLSLDPRQWHKYEDTLLCICTSSCKGGFCCPYHNRLQFAIQFFYHSVIGSILISLYKGHSVNEIWCWQWRPWKVFCHISILAKRSTRKSCPFTMLKPISKLTFGLKRELG